MTQVNRQAYSAALQDVAELAEARISPSYMRQLDHILAEPGAIDQARSIIPTELAANGLGLQETMRLLQHIVVPALAQGHSGPRYYGFVTGGALPEAQLADHLTTIFDNNYQTNLAEESLAVWLEYLVCQYVLRLLGLAKQNFEASTLTTGATSSNVLGLAVGREKAIRTVKERQGKHDWSVAQDGFGGVDVRVFEAGAHLSITKAAAAVGIGRSRVESVRTQNDPTGVAFDLQKLERRLEETQEAGEGAIVVAAYGEVNTGALNRDLPALRKLCDEYDVWLHLDGAFAAFTTLHPDFASFGPQIALADSLTVDAHKWLNVPYDSALFFARSRTALTDVFGPGPDGPPAYLLAPSAHGPIPTCMRPDLAALSASLPSPANCGIENSRRLRALPLFAALTSLGIDGYRDLFVRNIEFARGLDRYLRGRPDRWTTLIPNEKEVGNIVLFRPSEETIDAVVVAKRINEEGKIYVGKTDWMGRSALRMAICNWQTTLEEDLKVVCEALEAALDAEVKVRSG